ncbi:MAG TPA: hypothetical protein ENN03_01455 [bacterium]|nr:hypothetical protein [bacterium]
MKPGPYPFTFSRKTGEDFSSYVSDESGLPMVRLNRRRPPVYNPVTICQYGLDRGRHEEEILLKAADWLMRHAEKSPGGHTVWHYSFDFPLYGMKSPWISAMAQGQAISLLVRAHALTGHSRYSETAESALDVLFTPVEQGGTLRHFSDGHAWLEEYPLPGRMTGVLNGCLFALIGIYEFARSRNSHTAQKLFENVMMGLYAHLKDFDTGFWTYYDLSCPPRIASVAYHRNHFRLLDILWIYTGDQRLHEYSTRWKKYAGSPLCRIRRYIYRARYALHRETPR